MSKATKDAIALLKGSKDKNELEKFVWESSLESEGKDDDKGGLEKMVPGSEGAGIAIPQGSAGAIAPNSGPMNMNMGTCEIHGKDGCPESCDYGMDKALTSRSLHIPKPYGNYDPFEILRSATTATSSRFSGLINPAQNFAPDVLNTFEDVANKEKARTHITYKSCSTHGITYRTDRTCAPCDISKATTCGTCGTTLNKALGGLFCPNC